MNNFKITLLFTALLSFSLSFTSCGSEAGEATSQAVEKATDAVENTADKAVDAVEEVVDGEKQGKEYTSAHICPMHCEGSGSHEAGNCPVCGMAYVANENYKAPEHDHEDGDHEGEEH